MAKFIQKFENQSAYDAAEHQYPNTSLVGNDIVFAMAAPPVFGGLTVKYNITQAETQYEVSLFNGGGASSGSSKSESGGGGALPTRMIVDGVSETPINTWRFETAGEHIVQYEFADNIVPAGFLQSNSNATEAIIGDDITEIADSSANVPGAFENSVITTVTIGTGITKIGENAFYMSELETLTVKADYPPTLGSNALADSYITAIYVPASAVDVYKESTSTGWYQYASIIQAIS